MSKFNEGDTVRLKPDVTSPKICARYFEGTQRVTNADRDSTVQLENNFWYSTDDLEFVTVKVDEDKDEPELKEDENLQAEDKPRKKKILYPIGTEVEVREEYLGEGPWLGNTYSGRRVVLDYIKGSAEPYVLSLAGNLSTPSGRKFKVTEIQRYKGVDSHPEKSTTVYTTESQKSIDEDEVAKRIKEAETRIVAKHVAENHKLRDEIGKLSEMLAISQRAALCPPTIITTAPKKAEKKKTTMTTIREKIRYATLSSDEKVLRESGILSENGNLTDVGRRVLCDILFENEENRKAIVKLVKATLPKEK